MLNSLGTAGVDFFGVGYVAALKVIAGASFGQWKSVSFGDWGGNGHLPDRRGFRRAHLGLLPLHCGLVCLFLTSAKLSFIVFTLPALRAAALVYGFTYNLFFDFEQTYHIVRGSVESVDLAGTFSTYPNPHINFVQAFAVEMVITAILMGLILALTDDGNGVPRGLWLPC